MLFVSPKIKVDFSPIHGRGVFALSEIEEGELIEECHFFKLDEKDFSKLDPVIKEMAFAWPMGSRDSHAIVLGFGTIYNHNDLNNATWITDLIKNCYRFYAIKRILPGEEICTNYMKYNTFQERLS